MTAVFQDSPEDVHWNLPVIPKYPFGVIVESCWWQLKMSNKKTQNNQTRYRVLYMIFVYYLKFSMRGISKYLLFYKKAVGFFVFSPYKKPVRYGIVRTISLMMKYYSEMLLALSLFFPVMQEFRNCKYSNVLLIQG